MGEKKGIISMLIIKFLSEGPSTGYQLMKRIEEVLGRRPSSGTIYPALKSLERGGLIESTRDGKRVRYRLTTLGAEHLERLREMRREYLDWYEGMRKAFGEVFPSMKKDIDEMKLIFTCDVLTPLRSLIAELRESGVDEGEIRRVIEEARQKLRSLSER